MQFTFTAEQQSVLTRIAAGDTIQAASEAAGVHRNTVLNWRRSSPGFRSEWDSLQYEQAMHWRDQALPLAPLAINAIREILEDANTSPSIRLRAALAIHKIVSTPPPAQPESKSNTLNSIQGALTYLQQLQDTSEARMADLEEQEAADAAADNEADEAIPAPDTPAPSVVQTTPTANPAQPCTTDPLSTPLTVTLDPRKAGLDGLTDTMQQLIDAKRARLEALRQRTPPKKAA